MKKLFAAIFLVAAPVVAITANTAVAHAAASGAEANLGMCHQQQVSGYQNSWYAPAKSGVGPLVLVNGVVNYANGFAGGMGCYK